MDNKRPLKFTDDAMFCEVMRDERIARGVLGAILGEEVGEVKYHNVQQVEELGIDQRGIRMDVYLEGAEAAYDIEMQTYPQDELGLRCRYYQSAIDSRLLKKGQQYSALRNSFVIFVCGSDVFGQGIPRYTFEQRCIERGSVKLDTRQQWLVLNADAWEAEERKSLRDLLEYVAKGDSAKALKTSSLVRRINGEVDGINRDEERRASMISQEEREKSIARGVRKAVERRENKLVVCLLDQGREEDLLKAMHDPSYKEQLMEEFDIRPPYPEH